MATAKKKSAPRKVKATVVNAGGIENGNSVLTGMFPTGLGPQLVQTDSLFDNMRFYLVSNMRQPLSEAYAEIGLIQTIVDVPVEDALRGGVEIKSKQLAPDQVEKLQIWLEQESILETSIGYAHKWDRLYGGAGIIILSEMQDPEEPLDLESLDPEDHIEYRPVDMWELFYDKQNAEGYNPAIQAEQFSHYNYYGMKVHRTRVMPLKGIRPPSFIKPRLRGWGLSVTEALIAPLNQFLKTRNVVFEILDEFKIDYYQIEGLTSSMLSPGGKNKIQGRVADMNMSKNYLHAVTMDAKDSFQQKQLSFAGLADIPKENRMEIAATLRMPMTKVFGMSASGFSSGEDDIENYNAMIESSIRGKAKPHIITILEIRCQQLYGFIPDDLQIDFRPLRVLSAEQQENVKNAKFTRLLQAKQAGLITVKEFKDACNKSDLFDIHVDTSIETLDLPEAPPEPPVEMPKVGTEKKVPTSNSAKGSRKL